VPELKIALTHAGTRAERAVTTGTKAWELYDDQPEVVAVRVRGTLRDLSYELADGD
jgi:threonyl-tRNA synthetase